MPASARGSEWLEQVGKLFFAEQVQPTLIARAAEDRFLGEVGADFRDAYEGNREKTNDT